jgi:hypothetical protein
MWFLADILEIGLYVDGLTFHTPPHYKWSSKTLPQTIIHFSIRASFSVFD